MLTRQQFYSIFACLLLLCQGVRAQGLAAALHERAIYDGLPVEEQIQALVTKAECLEAAGEWDSALESLRRVPLFAADDAVRRRVVKEELRCLAMTGRYDEFDAMLDEALLTGAVPASVADIAKPRMKSEDLATLLSALPGLGHLYAGRPLEGLGSFAINAAVIGAGVAAFCSQLYAGAFLGAGMVLARTHTAGTASAIKAVRTANETARKEYCLAVLLAFS